MATHDDTEIQGLLDSMNERLRDLERACAASRSAWAAFLRLREELRISSEALRPIRRGLYSPRIAHQHR